MSDTSPSAESKGPILAASEGFTGWLATHDISLALTTYQASRLVFIGRRPDGSLRGHERMIPRCLGLWTDGQSLWASSQGTLFRFHNILPNGMTSPRGADRLFVPREARMTGAIDVHDLALAQVNGADLPIFVATAYNCLATLSETAGFRPLWIPRFISALVAEDRCHLNGLAMRGKTPAYVTAVAATDVLDGWRDRRTDGGVVLDLASSEVVASGLSMPHSPRLGQQGEVWLLNSGTGELGWVDTTDGRFTPVAFLPGFARGLALVNGHAIVGISRPRGNITFQGLPLADAMQARGAEPRCGLMVIELATGRAIHWLRFEHTITELYDVAILHGIAQPEAVGIKPKHIEQLAQPEASPLHQRRTNARGTATGLPR